VKPAVQVGFVVDKVTLEQDLPWELWSSPTSYHCIHVSFSSNIQGWHNRPIWGHSLKASVSPLSYNLNKAKT
jgi:hypothetical protein